MAIQNKLCNPTPFDVEIPYEKGIVIKIPAFGATELTMQQMDDYRDGKPGSENVQENLDYYGLFLLDADRPYNNQALRALKASLRAKEERLRDVRTNIQSRSINLPQGGADPETQLITMGFGTLIQQTEILKEQIAYLEKSVVDDEGGRAVKQLDPNRTIFVMNPPTEFPSKEAMGFFLNLPQNAAIKEAHEAFVAAQEE